MRVVQNRVPKHPGRVELTQVDTNIYDMNRADEPTQEGTPVNAALLNAIFGFDNITTVFQEDGTIVQTDPVTGSTKTTTFNEDGSITEVMQTGDISLTKTTTFHEDGSISEVVG